jgi:tellurite resistance protein TerC
MGVGTQVWAITLIALVGILLADLLIIGRKPHEPSAKESGIWVALYLTLAVLFGIGIWLFEGGGFAGQFFAGWLTEYSLSVDNLFVFVIIMARFAVPRHLQQKVLMIGIVMALIMRGIFIAAGAALISRFDWIFFIFGAFLLYTAVKMVRHGGEEEGELKENTFITVARRWLRTSPDYDEKGRLVTTLPDGRRILTPLIIVIIAIGTTDLIFALDSIPAIFGLTHEAYIVFTANVFALMGLRQLYFLLGNLLDRLKYLSHGLAVVLGFIGVKLILEALAGNNLPFINNGQPVSWAPHVPIWFSLGVIGLTLGVTTALSLISTRNDRIRAAAAAAPAGQGPTRDNPPRKAPSGKRPAAANRRQPTRRR